MKYADLRLLSKMSVDRFKDAVVVTNQCRNVLFTRIADAVPTMVSEVVHDQVEFVGQE